MGYDELEANSSVMFDARSRDRVNINAHVSAARLPHHAVLVVVPN
jgi:hypothetical protein